uniref:Retrotransposon Gag domain, retroviral aspartyl protease n=1 Tax=Tanacetum cinerariifolium TaxID=118510 RepID=A0A6L2KAI7_TANCI|nr:retrotransposon Gag domain, retroviral aspartyl protease [Tanacetum cinerariifolium]
MVQTQNSENNNPPDPIATQLAAIAAKLEAIETMKEDIAALKEGDRSKEEDRSRSKGRKNFDGESSWRGRKSYRPYNKIDFPNFSGGDPRGWLLKAKKYFRRETAEISLHAILGKPHPTTMKVHVEKFPAFRFEDKAFYREGSNDKDPLKYLSFGSIAGNQNMVQTRNSENNNPPDPIATQLAAKAAKLEAIETMNEERIQIDIQRKQEFRWGSSWRGRQSYRPYNKIDFPNFSGGDPRGWMLKAKKYFRYYQIPDEEKEELVQAFTKNFGQAEFQNPDEFLCSIKQTGSIQEYRQEFAKRSSRVSNWRDHCLLGVFLNGLKDELKSYARIHKPRTVYSAMSLALEFESKLTNHQPGKNASCTPNSKPSKDSKPTAFTPSQTSQPKNTFRTFETEKQNRFLKEECFRCGDKYEPGHLCKTGTLKVLEANEDVEEPLTADPTNLESDPEETVEISLHAILGKPHPTTMKIHGMLHSTEVLILIDEGSTHNFNSDVLVNEFKLATQPLAPFGVQISNGDVSRCGQICKNLLVQINDIKITQDFHPFSLGGADLILGIQRLATLNTVQANRKELFMIFSIDGKQYKLEGIVTVPQKSSSFQHLAVEPEVIPCIPAPLQPIITQYTTVFEEPQHLPLLDHKPIQFHFCQLHPT